MCVKALLKCVEFIDKKYSISHFVLLLVSVWLHLLQARNFSVMKHLRNIIS